jgi:hypothetical protein
MLPGFIEQEPVTVAPADVVQAAFHLSRYVRSEAGIWSPGVTAKGAKYRGFRTQRTR